MRSHKPTFQLVIVRTQPSEHENSAVLDIPLTKGNVKLLADALRKWAVIEDLDPKVETKVFNSLEDWEKELEKTS